MVWLLWYDCDGMVAMVWLLWHGCNGVVHGVVAMACYMVWLLWCMQL